MTSVLLVHSLAPHVYLSDTIDDLHNWSLGAIVVLLVLSIVGAYPIYIYVVGAEAHATRQVISPDW